MNTKRIIATAVVLVAAVAMTFAAGTPETYKLWNQANKSADASSQYVAGTRDIVMQTLGSNGNVLSTSGVSVEQEGTLYGRYIDRETTGDASVVSFLDTFFDGGVITPFLDNLYNVSFAAAGTETINGTACQVYDVFIAFDKNMLTYTPNYENSGVILGWDAANDTFSGDYVSRVWIAQDTAALVKLENIWDVSDLTNTTLVINQTVNYVQASNGSTTVSIPSTIVTTGLVQGTVVGGYTSDTNFQVAERQNNFFLDTFYVRGNSDSRS